MNCPSQILSTTSPRPTDTQKTLQHPIPRFAMINTEFGVFAILFCLGMLAWWWHWHERNSSRPVTRRRKEICCPDFGSPGWVGIGPWKIWMPKNDLWKEFFHKQSSLEMCKEVGVCVCVSVWHVFFATGVNFHQSGIEVRCAKSANFHASSGVRFAVVLMNDFFSGDLCSPTPRVRVGRSWMSKGVPWDL